MLELDIPESSLLQAEEGSLGGGGGLYRCRTFPGLKDLVQEQPDSDDEEGYFTDPLTPGTMPPSPGLFMSSSLSSWEESLQGSSGELGFGLEEGEGERESVTSSSPGILLSCEDLLRGSKDKNNPEDLRTNKCWVESSPGRLHKNSTFTCLTSGTQSPRRQLRDSDSDDSDEEEQEDLSVHCYILKSASKSSFYFVKRSLEAIPEDEEPPETTSEADFQSEAGIEMYDSESDQSETRSQTETQHIESDQSECSIPADTTALSQLEPSTDLNQPMKPNHVPATETYREDATPLVFKYDPEITKRYQARMTILEELAHQDMNDMYSFLSYMPQTGPVSGTGSGSDCRPGRGRAAYLKDNRHHNLLGSPMPSGLVSNYRPKCAKVFPAESEDASACVNAWVYQDNRTTKKKPAKPDPTRTPPKHSKDSNSSDTIERIPENSPSSATDKNSGVRRMRTNKGKKHSRGYAFLHRIWKSVRRKFFVLEAM